MKLLWDVPLDPAGIVAELDDGTEVRIRPAHASDRDELVAAFDRFSERSRYLRFFSPMPTLREPYLTSLTDIDPSRQLAWAVFDPNAASETGGESGLAIASARLFLDPDEPTAEATLAVVDDYQRRGIGRFLIDLLLSTAAIQELTSIHFDVLAQNRGMRKVLASYDASAAAVPDDPTIVRYTLIVPAIDELDPTAGALYELLRMIPPS